MAHELSRDDMDMLAAEYVLGVLEANERSEARGLIDGNGTMRALAEAWEQRFAPMNADFPEIAAPDVWPGLDRQLFARSRRRKQVFWLALGGLAVFLVVKIAFWTQLLI